MNNLLKLCVAGVILVAVALYVFKMPINSLLFYAFLLVCPLMHFLMMHGDHGDNTKHSKHT